MALLMINKPLFVLLHEFLPKTDGTTCTPLQAYHKSSQSRPRNHDVLKLPNGRKHSVLPLQRNAYVQTDKPPHPKTHKRTETTLSIPIIYTRTQYRKYLSRISTARQLSCRLSIQLKASVNLMMTLNHQILAVNSHTLPYGYKS